MARQQIIEGTGEELARYFQSKDRATKMLRVTVEMDDAKSASKSKTKIEPNEKMLAFLDWLDEQHKKRPETDGSKTVSLIIEARNGAMYDRVPISHLYRS